MKYAGGIMIIGLAASLAAAAPLCAQKTKPETQAQLLRQAKISKAIATRTALAKVPKGRVQSSEIEREKGRLIYSFDIKVPGKSGIEEVNVDAMTGAVVAHEHETPKMEKKEAATEKKNK
jgi:uncharacterized membrane protein YkoI